MILENYNDALKENIETELSFTVNSLPILQVRPFDPEVYNDEDFILPYFVDSYLNTGYEEDVLGSTFTVIVSLDEDTKPESEVTRWKQTTYGGEHVISLGIITELGEHTLSIKSVEDSGIASDTKFFKFYVTERMNADNMADFSGVDSFEASETDFKWDTWSPFWFIRPADSVGHYQQLCIYKYNDNNTCKTSIATRNIDYRVEFIRTNGVLTGIDVKVHGTIEYPYQKDNQGRYPVTTTINLNGNPDNQEDMNGESWGTYSIKNTCTINGNQVSLMRYLSKDTDDNTMTAETLRNPPDEVRIAASRNKIGIQFLLWACDAYCKQHGKIGFKLPKYDYIISYANGLDFSETSEINNLKRYESTSITPETRNINSVQLDSRNDIWFPNKDVLIDFNYSTIKCLNHTGKNIHSSKIVQIRKGLNVKLMNLYIAGDYCNAETQKPGVVLGEARSGIKLARCRFTSLENVRISHTMGYEMTGENDTPFAYNKEISVFNEFGYIGYNGNTVPVVRQMADDGASTVMYTDDFVNIGDIATDPKYNRAFHIINSTNPAGFAGVDTSGRYRSDGDAVFVSFYNNSNKFIKTVKIRLWDTGFIPYGATKCRLSAIGCIAEGTINRLVATHSNGAKWSGLYFASVPNWLIGNRIINCIIHDTRTCLTILCGLQLYMNGVITNNVAGQGESYGKLTPQLADIEDAAMNHYHIWLNGWSHIGGLYGVINAQHGNDICCMECPNLSISHNEIRDGIISNSIMGLTLSGASKRIIRKNMQITNSYIRSRISYKQGAGEFPMTYYLKNCFIANTVGDPTIEEINNTTDSSINIHNYGN